MKFYHKNHVLSILSLFNMVLHEFLREKYSGNRVII